MYVKVGKITVSRELKAMLGTLRAGWNRKHKSLLDPDVIKGRQHVSK